MPEKKNIIELTRITVQDYRKEKKFPLIVVLDNVRSLYNVGSIFRTADAFLLEKIILCGITGTPPHPEIKKTALGAEDSVEWEYMEDSFEAVKRLKNKGWKICVLEQVHDSLPLQDFSPSPETGYVLVAGNEVEGVDQKIVDLADFILEIPQLGVKHSLNVSVSVGIALWQMLKSKL